MTCHDVVLILRRWQMICPIRGMRVNFVSHSVAVLPMFSIYAECVHSVFVLTRGLPTILHGVLVRFEARRSHMLMLSDGEHADLSRTTDNGSASVRFLTGWSVFVRIMSPVLSPC